MPEYFPPRPRKVRILATLGPASRSPEMIRALHLAGADAFRVNMSHGTQEDEARALIYGMPQSEWKAKYQTEATPEQLRRMDESVAKNRADHAGNGDLDQALEQSFPASDPPEMTQP